MKKTFTLWQIIGLVICLIGGVFLVLCIATDICDDFFLPAALVCVLAGNVIQLIYNIRIGKKSKK